MRAFILSLSCVLWAATASAQSVSATFGTATKPGVYAPANCVSVWVEDSQGAFVKTIGRWSGAGGPAGDRTIHLVAWRAKAGTTDVDAVSGATRIDHAGTLNVTWDMKNKAGAIVPDGTYKIRMEMTEDNSTMATQNLSGTFTFVKSATPQKQMGLAATGFTNVSIDFTPSGATCNNGVVEAGETCDGGCPTTCPASTDPCMENVLLGGASTCDAECVLQPIPGMCDGGAEDLGGGCSTTGSTSGLWLLGLGLVLAASRRKRPLSQ